MLILLEGNHFHLPKEHASLERALCQFSGQVKEAPSKSQRSELEEVIRGAEQSFSKAGTRFTFLCELCFPIFCKYLAEHLDKGANKLCLLETIIFHLKQI